MQLDEKAGVAVRDDRVAVAPGVELHVRRWSATSHDPARSDGPVSTDDRATTGPVADGGTARAPFLLVHGLASNARTWDGVAPILALAGHDVTAVDLRGHGTSSKPDDGYDFETVTDDLRALIEHLHLDRPIAMGQSWGGNLVVELGLRFPGLVRAIVGVDGGLIELADRFPDWEECRRVLAPPRLTGTPAERIEAYLRGAHPDWPESGIRGTLANFEIRPDGTVAPWLTFDRHILILRALWEHRPSDRLRAYPLPLLLVLADGRDELASEKRAAAERAAALGDRVLVRWFAGADHDIHAERPAELADVVLESIADGALG